MKPEWQQQIQSIAQRCGPDWVQLRRRLHENPELSGQEFGTTRRLAAAAEQLKLPVHVFGPGRGLTAELVTDSSLSATPRFGIRGDIDALPIQDTKMVDYRSKCDGIMHACGHDVHATCLLAALEILSSMHRENTLPWPIAIRALFQPAEETCEGAKYMIHHHALRNVSSILALHVDPTRSVGCIGLRSGPFAAACDLFEVHFHGRGGHGARPHLSIDPIDASTLWVQSAYRRLNRANPPTETVTMSIGQIEAGHSANVIPDRALLRGSLRSLDDDVRRRSLDLLESIGESVTNQTGCHVDLQLGMSSPAVINDESLVNRLHEMATGVIDPASPEWIDHPSMGSEDFSYYLKQIPGAMFRLGIAGPQTGHEPLHTPNFDVDEECIAIGAQLMAATAIDYFDPSRSPKSD